MFSSKIMLIYRLVVLLILSIPIAINIVSKGDIVSSIIYLPLLILGLSAIAIFIDGKLEVLLNRAAAMATLKVPVANSELNTTNDKVNFYSHGFTLLPVRKI